MEWTQAVRALALLDATLLAAFVLSVLAMLVSWRLFGLTFCQVCVAVSSVWVANLLFGFAPPWVTVLLMGQSVAGGAGMARDRVARRLEGGTRTDAQRRLVKQLAYFGAILAGTAGAMLLAGWRYPGLLH